MTCTIVHAYVSVVHVVPLVVPPATVTAVTFFESKASIAGSVRGGWIQTCRINTMYIHVCHRLHRTSASVYLSTICVTTSGLADQHCIQESMWAQRHTGDSENSHRFSWPENLCRGSTPLRVWSKISTRVTPATLFNSL